MQSARPTKDSMMQKIAIFFALLVSAVALSSCGDKTTYIVVPQEKRTVVTPRTTTTTPRKYVGSSSTYRGDPPESFRAVVPAN